MPRLPRAPARRTPTPRPPSHPFEHRRPRVMNTLPPAIVTAGLTKHYPEVAALDDLSIEVPTGSIYGFLGPNGAGKTTALKMLAGLTRPTKGTAVVAGIPVEAGPAYRSAVGYLGQEPRFYGWMSGRETIEYVGSLYPRDARPNSGRIQEVLELVGISDAADRSARGARAHGQGQGRRHGVLLDAHPRRRRARERPRRHPRQGTARQGAAD